MFGWLADLLVKTPIQGSGCACCEAKKSRLQKMQREILSGTMEDNMAEGSVCGDTCCGGHCNDEVSTKEMRTTAHYRIEL